jgi:hypothetical protein
MRTSWSENKLVHVTRSKEDIKNAPEYHEDRHDDEGYRCELGGYYDPLGPLGD